jgi:hypothetical protein
MGELNERGILAHAKSSNSLSNLLFDNHRKSPEHSYVSAIVARMQLVHATSIKFGIETDLR